MATTKNDITGDVIQSKGTSDKYREGWERIFGKKSESKEEEKVDVTSDSEYSARVP